MIVRPQQHWPHRIFVQHGSALFEILSRSLLNFLFSIVVIFMLPQYTHLGIKFTLAPFSTLGVAIAIFLVFVITPGTLAMLKRKNLGGS